ncbi:MAG: flavin reductase [Caldilineaceae bacterium]
MGTHFEGTDEQRRSLSVYIKLMRAAESTTSRINDHLRDYGLTVSQFGVLEALYHLGPMCQGDLARKILKSSGNLTTVVDNLARDELVEHVRSDTDRRMVHVHLTDKGRALIEQILLRTSPTSSQLSPSSRWRSRRCWMGCCGRWGKTWYVVRSACTGRGCWCFIGLLVAFFVRSRSQYSIASVISIGTRTTHYTPRSTHQSKPNSPNGATPMILNPNDMPERERYKLVTGTVVPRPIAWVSSVNAQGQANLAPFSFFTVASSSPLTMLFSVSHKPDGSRKDTWVNALETGEFVINIVDEANGPAMNQSATTYPHGVSEFEMTGLTAVPGEAVRAPRVAEAPVSYECKLTQIVEVGGNAVIFGEVQAIHVREDVYDGRYVDIAALKPVGRLAGNSYCRVNDLFELIRE